MGRRIRCIWLLARILACCAAVGIASPNAAADTCTWDGSTGSWHSGGSWSCGHEPGASDTAIINSGTVTVTSNVTVGSLTQGGGNIDGAGDLTISSVLVWTGGTHGGTGETTLGPGATWQITGSSRALDRDFRNEGTITWTGANVSQPAGVTFTNVGTIDIQGDDYWGTSGSGAVLDNQGTINKSAGTITYIDSVFSNSGSVTVSAGTFQMRANTTTTGSFTSTGPGVVYFASGTHDLLASSAVTGQNVSFTGSGTATISGTYTTANSTFNSNIYLNNGARTLQNINLQGRTMNGDSDLTISNQLTWSCTATSRAPAAPTTTPATPWPSWAPPPRS